MPTSDSAARAYSRRDASCRGPGGRHDFGGYVRGAAGADREIHAGDDIAVALRPDELRRLDVSGIATADRQQRVVEQLRGMLQGGPRLAREIHEFARQCQLPRLVLFAAKAERSMETSKCRKEDAADDKLGSGLAGVRAAGKSRIG